MEDAKIKQIIEALIFATDKPLPLNQIDEVLDSIGPKVIQERIDELNSEYKRDNRPYRIKEIAGGFVVATIEEFACWLKKLYKTQSTERLSAPALETLAIIAYKQPVTKPAIEAIRGVGVDGVLKTLLERSMIKISGRQDTPGRPFIYSTTKEFLRHFGLGSLKKLPPIEEFGLGDVHLGADKLLIQKESQEIRSGDRDEKKA